MIFAPCPIAGMFEILSEPHQDSRGAFARIFCEKEFHQAGITFDPVQMNLSVNTHLHTLRGLHFQRPPNAEAKTVRAVRGSVWDVAVDLREGEGFGRWHAVELDEYRMNAVFLPEGVAHGFLTTTDHSTVLYQMGRAYKKGHGRGIRWNDPDLNIAWPAKPEVLSQQDATWPQLGDVPPISMSSLST